MAFNSDMWRMLPPVTKNLLLVNAVVFVMMLVLPHDGFVYKYLAVHYFTSPAFNPGQLFTYMFVHGGFFHFFFNMWMLLMFGPQIEWAVGSKRFLFYYISCGIGAALVQEGVYAILLHKYTTMFTPEELTQIINEGYRAMLKGMNFTDPTLANINTLVNTPVVGASGAIYGVLLAFGMLFPNREIMLLIPPVPMKAKWMVLVFGLLELSLGAFNASDNVAHFAHVGGMLFGFLIIWYWKKKNTFHGYY